MRFVWDLPLSMKRKFVRGIDAHLSDRYPMFAGLSVDWPMNNGIPPYIRDSEARTHDFGLVNQGYLGYMELGHTARDVDLFVWLEVLRDKNRELSRRLAELSANALENERLAVADAVLGVQASE